MLGIAEGTAEVASAEAHENSGRSGVVAFALEGVKDFINPKHVDCFVASLLAMTLVKTLRSVIFYV